MTITVPRPRLLLLLLALMAMGAIAYRVAADDQSRDPPLEAIPVGSEPELPQVTPEESARAQAALRADPAFINLTKNVEWKLLSEIPNTRNGKKVGVGLILELGGPIDSSGPWKYLHCRGTVTLDQEFQYMGITSLGAVFDSNGRLIGLTPLGIPGSELTSVGQEFPKPQCPKGFEDEES